MARIQGYPRFKALLDSGLPAAGYKMYSYLAGTSTPEPTYTDQTEVTQNTNPVILDGSGEAAVWLKPGTAYKLVLRTDADVDVWTVDAVHTAEGGYFTTLSVTGAATMATISVTGQITSTVSTGTPPFVVASTTEVANLKSADSGKLGGKTWAAPDPIGSTTPAAGTFTTVTEKTQGVMESANGAQWIRGQASEEITLNTGAAATDSVANLLPANSIIEAVVYRITQAITTAANFTVGDSAQAARFLGTQSTLTLGATGIGLLQHNPANASNDLGPVQSAAAKVRITCNAAPGAGKVRVTVFYRQFVAPTS